MGNTQDKTSKEKKTLNESLEKAKEAREAISDSVGVSKKQAYKEPEEEPSYEAAKKKLEGLAEGIKVLLPSSDIVVRMSTPSMTYLIKTGQIPKHLVAVAMKQETSNVSLNPEEIEKYVEFLDTLVCTVVKEPKFSLKPDPEKKELDVNLLDDQDKMFVYEITQMGAGQLEKFRERHKRVLSSRSGSQKVREATK